MHEGVACVFRFDLLTCLFRPPVPSVCPHLQPYLHHPKRTPAVGAAGEERKEREEEKGLNYRELMFLISCLLTCSIRVHDAVCV